MSIIMLADTQTKYTNKPSSLEVKTSGIQAAALSNIISYKWNQFFSSNEYFEELTIVLFGFFVAVLISIGTASLNIIMSLIHMICKPESSQG